MKTKNYLLAIALMLSGNILFAQEMKVNTEKSSIEWQGKKIGGKHEGFIQLQSGSFEWKKNKIVSGNFVVDMNSITNTDLKDEGTNQKLVGHLKSDDFFSVETYPTASFELIESTPFNKGKATLTGNITIKDKTERISFEVVKSGNEYAADVEIDRSKFDVRFGSKSFFNNLGDRAINDIFTLKIKLVVS